MTKAGKAVAWGAVAVVLVAIVFMNTVATTECSMETHECPTVKLTIFGVQVWSAT